MADVSIPREAVDRGARAYYAAVKPRISQRAPEFDDLPEGTRALAFAEAEAALNAAAPLIVAAELDRIVNGMPSRGQRSLVAKISGLDDDSISTLNIAMDEIQAVLRDRAQQLRAQA